MSDIKPGSQISVKIIKRPTNAAGVKTVVRLLSKDQAVMTENDRLKKTRKNHYRQIRRGGRYWDVNVVKQHPVKGVEGETGTFKATLDVITDLKSIEKFVEVTTV